MGAAPQAHTHTQASCLDTVGLDTHKAQPMMTASPYTSEPYYHPVLILLLLLSLSLFQQELGASGLSKRPTSVMLILPKPPKGGADDAEAKEFAESYSEVEKKLKTADKSV